MLKQHIQQIYKTTHIVLSILDNKQNWAFKPLHLAIHGVE